MALLVAPWFLRQAEAADDDSTVIDIGSRRELFADDFLIERFGGEAELRMHHPVPREVAMVWDKPWEGNTTGYATVIQDGDLYRMFYRGWQYRIEPGVFNQKHSATLCYAESRDGIHWTRPELGLFGYPGPTGSKQNNIVLLGGKLGDLRFDPSTFMVLKDDNPACAPDARFKGLVLATPFDKELWRG